MLGARGRFMEGSRPRRRTESSDLQPGETWGTPLGDQEIQWKDSGDHTLFDDSTGSRNASGTPGRPIVLDDTNERERDWDVLATAAHKRQAEKTSSRVLPHSFSGTSPTTEKKKKGGTGLMGFFRGVRA